MLAPVQYVMLLWLAVISTCVFSFTLCWFPYFVFFFHCMARHICNALLCSKNPLHISEDNCFGMPMIAVHLSLLILHRD